MNRILLALPALVSLGIGGFLLWGLDPDRDPNAVPSALIMGPVPEFDLPPIDGIRTPGLSTTDLQDADRPILVNLFASWCVPCRAEHAVLTKLSRQEGVPLMGINYQDKPADAAAWLVELGNPYDRIGSDQDGRIGLDWAISGVPETFVIDSAGTITHRHVGPILSAKDRAEVIAAVRAAEDAS